MVQVQVWSRNKDKKRERQRERQWEHKRGCKTTNTSQAKLALQPASQPASQSVYITDLYKWKYGKGILNGRGNGK